MKSNKILVVDDDKIVLESCRRILEEEGYRVLLVDSAEEAVDLLEMEYVDLLIMDMKMPTHDGMYLFDQIRLKWPLDIWPELPVIVMSGYPTPKTIKDGLNRGAADFIPKPFTPNELVSSVNKVLKRRKKDGPKESGNSAGTGN